MTDLSMWSGFLNGFGFKIHGTSVFCQLAVILEGRPQYDIMGINFNNQPGHNCISHGNLWPSEIYAILIMTDLL